MTAAIAIGYVAAEWSSKLVAPVWALRPGWCGRHGYHWGRGPKGHQMFAPDTQNKTGRFSSAKNTVPSLCLQQCSDLRNSKDSLIQSRS